ncbi:MAG: hypothetical protein ACI9UN_004091 [Granulosicoccus sp.]|jgi:hypothetical protein
MQRLLSSGPDHIPLLARLSFTPSRGSNQEGIKADATEHEWANEISEEQKVSKNDLAKPGETG